MNRATITLALLLGAAPSHAQAPNKTAFGMMEFCQNVGNKTTDAIIQFKAGVCFGAFQSLRYFSRMVAPVCIPPEVTLGQLARVFNAYAATHPEIHHDAYEYVALLALREAFPCNDGALSSGK